MTKERKITIPCKTYVRKYIEARYGSQLRITNHTTFGVYLLGVTEKKFYESRHRELGCGFISLHYNDNITFLASPFVFENIGFDLSEERILAVNRFLEAQLEEHLFVFCDAYALAGMQRKRAIEAFAEKYNIALEVDITTEALRKTEYRRRRKALQLREVSLELGGLPPVMV